MKKEITVKHILGEQAYWVINKKMFKYVGLEATLLLQHFSDLQQNIFDGEFYQQHDRIAEELDLSRRKIENAINVLRESGFLSVKRKGLPAKNYYKVEAANIATFLMYDDLFVPRPNKNNILGATNITV